MALRGRLSNVPEDKMVESWPFQGQGTGSIPVRNTMKQNVIIEIRDAEGGSDAKMLVEDMGDIYERAAKGNDLTLTILEKRPGYMKMQATGENTKIFDNEVGSHR